MMRGFLGVVLALALAVPGTSRAVSLVLTPEGGDPTSDGITDVLHGDVVSGGLFVFDVYLDIGATFGDQPNQAYADSLSFSSIFSNQFVIQANTALGVSFSDQGCVPGFSGYCPLGHDGSQPVWFSQVFGGDAGFVFWNDFLFANAGFSRAVPFDIADTGGFRPGLLQLGSLFVDIAPNELLQGSLILTP